MFTDVPASNPFCRWIEELARRGITGGCTATQYCPASPVTRVQMAVFVVKAMETCPTLDPTDEMIRVGGVCIDKYEASLWDAPVGGNQITGAIPCSPNGEDCTNIYARSVAGVLPLGSVTWFQAQAALRSSGKRLPTNAEWQMAALGTPDGFPCNTNSGGPVVTGSSPSCVSSAGALDMVGNLWEWVADWVPVSTACPGWGTKVAGRKRTERIRSVSFVRPHRQPVAVGSRKRKRRPRGNSEIGFDSHLVSRAHDHFPFGVPARHYSQ